MMKKPLTSRRSTSYPIYSKTIIDAPAGVLIRGVPIHPAKP